MKLIKAILIGAGARGADAYAPFALQHPDRLKFVAVAEPIENRLNRFIEVHNIEPKYGFSSYEEALTSDIEADVVIICTQDKMHYEPSVMAMENGYHVLLEKPIVSMEECVGISKVAKACNKSLTICHVLRYTPFFQEIKRLIDNRVVGELISITHNENVGYWHAAHSYVRGNWRNTSEACPMLLAKSCHDIDILMWLTGEKCLDVASFGSLKHFKSDKKPADASARCITCSRQSICPYNALKIYMNVPDNEWPVSVITDDYTETGRMNALLEGPYGRCVYDCDNDVVDHQAVILNFSNGITASFHMNAFTKDISREIKICCSHGEIVGKMEEAKIEVRLFLEDEVEIISLDELSLNVYGHGGGDYGLMMNLVNHLSDPSVCSMPSSLESAVESHIVTFASESSRLTGSIVSIDEYKRTYE